MSASKETVLDRAITTIRTLGSVFRTADALKAGIHPETLYGLRDAGQIERLERGLYRLADLPGIGSPDLVTVAMKVPHGVICLISALSYHELTTQIPHRVDCAVRRAAYRPRITAPPVHYVSFCDQEYSAGIEEHDMDGVKVRIYGAEKTLADCFKFRNQLGQDVVIEALRTYRARRRPRIDDLLRFAEACRVRQVMRPYLEAIL
jgi:predicted transcriptional regulator of viral defense system